jgi:hypothetical protein
MPIDDDSFETGTVEAGADEPPIAEEKRLILSFLSERPDQAFTEREIVLGVDFSPVVDDGGRTAIGAVVDGLVDAAGDATASAMVVDDVDEALAALVEEGAVEKSAVETPEGTTTYYRLVES